MANQQLLKRPIEATDNNEESSKSITCFPTEILLEITSKVASRSLADLHHLKLTSKEMMNIADDDYVYKHASLEKFPFFHIPKIPQEASFLSRCRSSGNLESMYREGMETCFGDCKDHQKGLDLLRVTAQEGHKRSKYAFAITVLMRWINMMRSGCLRKEDLHEALGNLRFLRNQKCVVRCRNEVARFVQLLMLKMGCRFGLRIPTKRLCENVPCKNTWRPKGESWSLQAEEDDENDPNMCESCRWDHELREFFQKLIDNEFFICNLCKSTFR